MPPWNPLNIIDDIVPRGLSGAFMSLLDGQWMFFSNLELGSRQKYINNNVYNIDAQMEVSLKPFEHHR